MRSKTKPIRIGGRWFASQSEAARYYNVSQSTVSRWAFMQYSNRPAHARIPQPCLINGTFYASVQEASRYLTLSYTTIRNRVLDPRLRNYQPFPEIINVPKRNRVSATAGAYADVTAILDRVLQVGPLELPMASEKAAFAFRHRVYRYRSILLRKAEADIADLIAKGLAQPGAMPSSPYDSIYIQIEGAKLIFRIRDGQEHLSNLRALDGGAVEISADPLEEEAAALRKKLDLG